MTKDEIIEMWKNSGDLEILGMPYSMIEAFAKLVAAKEREECADLLEHGCIDDEGHHLQYAKEIRARGERA